MRAQILAILRHDGPQTATRLRQSIGITHEQIYAALVSLEALGLAEFTGSKTWRAVHGIQKPAQGKSIGAASIHA